MRVLPKRADRAPAHPVLRFVLGSFALGVVVLVGWAATRPAVRSMFVAPKSYPPGPVEADYSANGRYATANQAAVDPDGTKYTIFRPADYAALGFLSPIVTWGVGTDGKPSQYTELLDHLASYGFTVIVVDQHNTGSGDDIADAARYLIAQAGTVGSVFQGRLDGNKVAAAGHSQGAGGAVRAAINNPSLIDTVVTISLPSTTWARANPDCPTKADCTADVTKLHQPTFLIGTHGAFDSVIASASTERSFFNEIPGRAVLGLIEKSGGKAADHNSVQSDSKSRGFLGYVTAWLCAELRGDRVAARAFDGTHPELVSNANWPGSAAR
jgi:hypothetical protein